MSPSLTAQPAQARSSLCKTSLALTLWSVALLTSLASGQALVADINSSAPVTPFHSTPEAFAWLDGAWIFAAEVPGIGRELMRSDGTPGGTMLLKDVRPGPGSSAPEELVSVGGKVYFAATTSEHGTDLWVTDGTEAGTIPLDINPGAGQSLPRDFGAGHDGLVFFSANTGSAFGWEPWVSDGTPGGTFRVIDLYAGSSDSDPDDWVAGNGVTYFVARAILVGREVWKTDGTEAGTVLVADIAPGFSSSSPQDLTLVGSQLFFSANGDRELYTSDGTPGGTSLVTDLWPAGSSLPSDLAAYNGELYFAAGAGGFADRELWKTDGTAGGTELVMEFVAGSAGGGDPDGLTVANGLLFFSAEDNLGRELWASDGTMAGTQRVLDIMTGGGSADIDHITSLGDQVVFEARNGPAGAEPWASDGTAIGTVMLADLNAAGLSSFPEGFTINVAGGSNGASTAIFSARGTTEGREPWLTDGTPLGTTLVSDVFPTPVTGSSFIGASVVLGDKLLFIANDGVHGAELWVSDGTEASTSLLVDIYAFGSSEIDDLAVFRDAVYFRAFDGASVDVWKTDGTVAGTAKHSSGMTFVEELVATDHGLYFSGFVFGSGREPFFSDGTTVTALGDEFLGGGSSDPEGFTQVGQSHIVVFAADDEQVNTELYRSNGTPGGTAVLFDISPGQFNDSFPADFVPLGDLVFFTAGQAATGNEPWITDGTPAGTQILKDIWPGGPFDKSSTPQSMLVVGNRIFFTAKTELQGRELWVSDGTGAGTIRLTDIDPGPDDTGIAHMAPLGNDRLVFSAEDGSFLNQALYVTDGTVAGTQQLLDATGTHIGVTAITGGTTQAMFTFIDGLGERLWTTDGTVSGTTEIAALSSIDAIDSVADMLRAGGGHHVVFAGNDVTNGAEVWVSDGTSGGTLRLTDIQPGQFSGTPRGFKRVRDQLFFTADDGVAGRELWAMPFAATDGWVAQTYGQGCEGTNGELARMVVSGEGTGGNVVDLGLAGGLASSLGALYFSLSQDVVSFGPCTFYLGPGFSLLDLVPIGVDGTASFPLPVPSKASLIGMSFFFQYAVVDIGGPVLGLATLSDVTELIIGP